jgi:putative effector of murein hydrolase
MTCPQCGYIYRVRFADQLWKFIGLIVAVCVALYGQAELIGEPWRHVVSMIAIGGTAGLAYWIKPAGTTTVVASSPSSSPSSTPVSK